MPSLLDNLTSSLGTDGFDFETAFSDLGGALTAVAPSGASLDQDALGGIGQALGGGGFGAIGTSVSAVLEQAGGLGGSLASPASLVQPLTGAFAGASSFASADPRSLLQLFEDARAVTGVVEGETRLRQVLAHHLRQAGVVFDHQELGGAHALHGRPQGASGLERSVKLGKRSIALSTWIAAKNIAPRPGCVGAMRQ